MGRKRKRKKDRGRKVVRVIDIVILINYGRYADKGPDRGVLAEA